MNIVSSLAWTFIVLVLIGLWPVTMAVVSFDFDWWMLETDVILYYWLPIGAALVLIVWSPFSDKDDEEQGQKKGERD